MSSYLEHLDREWDVQGWPREIGPEPADKDSPEWEAWFDAWPQAAMYQHMRKLLSVFGDEGHSGGSAPYAVRLFEKLAMFKPLSPLTGEESEWGTDASDDQNNRCSHVFRDSEGRAYDSIAVVFREPDGMTYTSRDSRRYITFPYTPKREYVDVAKGGRRGSPMASSAKR